jgi:nucleotide-binding universal stress UspA family protein
MYTKILVPLDGSELAECVFPHVESIAKGCDVSNVVFVRVVEPAHLPVATEFAGGGSFSEADAAKSRKKQDDHNKAAAKKYLDDIIKRNKYDGTTLKAEVIMGKPADSIAEYAEKHGVDLIVIATHGRSGISRWVYGSVADKILRSACVPVLMVRAPGCIPGI